MRTGELSLPPANGGIGRPSQSSAGELALVVWKRESQRADQLSYQPRSQIQGFAASKMASPADPRLHNLQNTEQQDNQKESQ